MIVIVILCFAMYKYKKVGLILTIYTIVLESFFFNWYSNSYLSWSCIFIGKRTKVLSTIYVVNILLYVFLKITTIIQICHLTIIKLLCLHIFFKLLKSKIKSYN